MILRKDNFIKVLKEELDQRFYSYIEIMEKEGESGFLYKVYSRKDDKPRVVKVYKDPIDNINKNLYLEDIKKLMKNNHENIIKAFEIGNIDYEGEKFFFCILEYVEGNSLEEIKSNIFWENHKYKERIELFKQALDAIGVLRIKYELHNDLHLGNLMLTSDKQIKIIDFGSSKESYTPVKTDIDLYLIKNNLTEFFFTFDELKEIKKTVNFNELDFIQFKQFFSELIKKNEDIVRKNIKYKTKSRALEILKKVENVNIKISEIFPEYLDFLLERNEIREKNWVIVEISGNIHEWQKKHEKQLKYREILSYISKSRIINPRGYTIEMIKAENPQMFREHYWIADYTIQELEEISIKDDTQILCGYYNRDNLEFYNYTSISAIKQILSNIRKKISEFLLKIIDS